jgi:hypothetical protein
MEMIANQHESLIGANYVMIVVPSHVSFQMMFYFFYLLVFGYFEMLAQNCSYGRSSTSKFTDIDTSHSIFLYIILTLVENHSSILVSKGLLYRLSNR